MTETVMDSNRSNVTPGEARTRRRQRRMVLYLAAAGLLGGLLGGLVAFNDAGDGNLFAGGYEALEIGTLPAIGLAAGFFFAFVVLPLWGFTQIDEMQRDQNMIGFTGGCIAVLAGFPMWAMLHAGGLAGPPDALGLFALAFAAMAGSFVYAKFRN